MLVLLEDSGAKEARREWEEPGRRAALDWATHGSLCRQLPAACITALSLQLHPIAGHVKLSWSLSIMVLKLQAGNQEKRKKNLTLQVPVCPPAFSSAAGFAAHWRGTRPVKKFRA